MAESLSPMIDSTALLDDPTALGARGDEDGYLYFRGLLPEEPLMETREALLGVLTKHRLRPTDAQPLDGRLDLDALTPVPADQMRTDIGVPIETYHDAQRLPCVHRLPHHSALLSLFRTLFGGEPFVHPRHIVRMVTPHPAIVPTPVHQDFPLIQGSPQTWTCWFPIGTCPQDLGGLAVLRGSHKLGFLPVKPASGAGGIAAQLCPGEDDWVTADYGVGDVLTFPSYTVHRACPCQRQNEVRLSFDVRYQPLGEPIEQRSLNPHCDLTWEEIYAGWTDDRDALRYYWRNTELARSPYDESLFADSPRVC